MLIEKKKKIFFNLMELFFLKFKKLHLFPKLLIFLQDL